MSQKAAFPKYPLPRALTGRVVAYLSVFRLVFSLGLLYALFADHVSTLQFQEITTIAQAVLISYFVMAVILAIEIQRQANRAFLLARVSLFIDFVFLSIIFFIFGGLEGNLAMLLIFTTAAAAILLPLRMALFLASLVVMVFIGKALVGVFFENQTQTELVKAGLYGATTFTTAILVNQLSRWLKDVRLFAERQAAQLTRLEQVNELVIRRMRNGVLAVDDNGDIQLMNESAWFLLGSPKVGQKSLAKLAPQLDRALKDWQNDPLHEAAAIRLHVSQRRVLPKFVSLPGTSNIRVLIFLEDSELVSQRAVEMSAHMLANLSGSIAHEIRNPLGAISHAAQLLEESEDIAEADLRLVDIIHSQSGRMNGIVENILQLSRHEKSRPDIFDVTTFLEELAVETKSSLPGIRLKLELKPEDKNTMVLFDRSQLHQTLWKLLENAWRHAYLDAAMPQVILSMNRPKSTGYCIITVEDNGPGITENTMTRIFDPFFTTHKEGSGLGLYIARQLCDVNQAELTVDSVVGSYSRFHIRLALARTGKNKMTGR